MELFFGALDGRGLDTFLLPQNAWLLMTGFPDVRQAARAATNFIINVRHLRNGEHVVVTGIARTVGATRAIEMSDVNAAGDLAPHFAATPDFASLLSAAEPEARRPFRRYAAKKGAAKKGAAKKGAAKKSAAKKGRR